MINEVDEGKANAANNMRLFPFDTTVTDQDLMFSGYGSGLKTDGKCTITIAAEGSFDVNVVASSKKLALKAADYVNIVGETSQPSGMVAFKVAKTKWGGFKACCASGSACTACDSVTADSYPLFGTNKDYLIPLFIKKGAKPQGVIRIEFTSLIAFPETHLTTIRGRGGLGASTQKLFDVFWAMHTSAATPTAVMMLLHFYCVVKTAVTDANMKLVYGFPINAFSTAATKKSGIDGRLAVGTGLKIYVAKDDAPLADYYGFYALRMTPFTKSTGKNEIEVVVNSDRAV